MVELYDDLAEETDQDKEDNLQVEIKQAKKVNIVVKV